MNITLQLLVVMIRVGCQLLEQHADHLSLWFLSVYEIPAVHYLESVTSIVNYSKNCNVELVGFLLYICYDFERTLFMYLCNGYLKRVKICKLMRSCRLGRT